MFSVLLTCLWDGLLCSMCSYWCEVMLQLHVKKTVGVGADLGEVFKPLLGCIWEVVGNVLGMFWGQLLEVSGAMLGGLQTVVRACLRGRQSCCKHYWKHTKHAKTIWKPSFFGGGVWIRSDATVDGRKFPPWVLAMTCYHGVGEVPG